MRHLPALLTALGIAPIWAFVVPSWAAAQDSLLVSQEPAEIEIPERTVLVVDSSALLVGGTVRILGGSTSDPAGEEGGAAVLALALNRVLAGSLKGTGSSAAVSVDREAFTVRFLAPREHWRTTTELVLSSVFSPLPVAIVDRARADHAQRLRFETGAPVRDFQERRFAALFGTTSEWARPARGTPTGVDEVDLEEVRARLVGADAGPAAFAALAGPFDLQIASELFGRFRGHGPPDRSVRPVETRAWDDGFQEWIPTEITSVWVSLAFPAYSSVPRDRLALLAHHVREYLTPIPRRPGIVAPQVDVLESLRGPVLLVTFAVAPESAEQWAARIAEVVRLERDAPPDDRFFSWQRRRFRTAYRLERASVDAYAAMLARERSVGLAPDTNPWTGDFQLSDLALVARTLGPPRVLLYGPSMSDR